MVAYDENHVGTRFPAVGVRVRPLDGAPFGEARCDRCDGGDASGVMKRAELTLRKARRT